jgi:hypothetical protein
MTGGKKIILMYSRKSPKSLVIALPILSQTLSRDKQMLKVK